MKRIFLLCALTLAAIGVLVWRAAAKPSFRVALDGF